MFDHLLGHTKAKALLSALRSPNPKAILLNGPTGLGKSLFAKELTKGVLCSQGPCACMTCSQVEAKTHPLVRTLSGEHGELTIDSIRSLDPDLNKQGTPLIQLYDIHHLTLPASHALLKAMEQQRAIFIMTGTLTPNQFSTLRSRCYDVPFYPVSKDVIKQYLLRRDPTLPEPQLGLLAGFSNGNFQQAEQCLLGRYQTVRDLTLILLEDLVTQPPHALFERTEFLETDPDAEGTLTLVRTAGLNLLRDLLLLKQVHPTSICNKDMLTKLETFHKKTHVSTLRAMAHAWQGLGLSRPWGQNPQQHLRATLVQLKALFPTRKSA